MSDFMNFSQKNGSGRFNTEMRVKNRMKLSLKLFLSLMVFGFVGNLGLEYVSNITSQLQNILQRMEENLSTQQAIQLEKAAQAIALVEKVEEKPVTKYELDDGITEEAARFIKELNLNNPGEYGVAVELPQNLSADIQKRIDDGFKTHGFNAFVSNMVSLNRKLPDVRSDWCKKQVYTNLPKCSIVIIFHNEDWMLLMRTVHSVLNRSPLNLIEEILLVDDMSDRVYLHENLENYIKKYPLIRVVRSHRRLGVISNRILGAVNAVGPIIVNIDCHMEVTEGWLEPILDRFTKNMNVLVMPKISSIDPKNLQVNLYNENPGQIGGFKWNMDFKWLNINDYEGDKPTETWAPKRSPTALGGFHAISKSFFKHVGMLDPEFDIWGGEDVELSFKVWLCGGIIEYVPCSFGAHMYKHHTYTFPEGKGGYRWNTDRIAEVWLDEYKRYYYRSVGDTKNRNYGNVSERIELKEKIGCKPFKWFIDNIHPNVPIPDDIKDPPPVVENKKPVNGTN